MDPYLTIAGYLTIVLGFVHSIIGEVKIFQPLRSGDLVPSRTGKLGKRHMAIIWASWHVVTVFGWCLGFILIEAPTWQLLLLVVAGCMFMSSGLVLIGTKGKHPGWIVLLIIGILVLIR